MSSLLIVNLSSVVTGDWRNPLREVSSIYIEDGLIAEIPSSRSDADTIIDARGLIAAPGLIDTHVHPTFGDFTPTQNSVGWMESYMHGGVTSLVSAGELHVPGLPLEDPDPRVFKYLAVLAKKCSMNLSQKPRLYAGTLLLTPGLTEGDFDEIAADGIGCVKFIFYPYGDDVNESERYVRWCRERDIVVKIHTGGVSRSGVSRPAGRDVVKEIQPDVAAHITGGPIPMPANEMKMVLHEMDCALEIATAGSFLRDIELMEEVHKVDDALDRIIVGTDTPSGTGVLPRAMMRNVALLASLCGTSPAEAWCLASGNGAIAHRLPGGFLQEGKPADLVLIGKIAGSVGTDALDGLKVGDIPGISFVIVDGEIAVRSRSDQTPPPETLAVIEKEA